MNSAQRIAAIYEDLSKADPNQLIAKIWVDIFNVVYPHPDAEDVITSCLVVLRKEISSLRSRLNKMDIPNDLLDPGFEVFYNACSSTNLNQGFSGLKHMILSPECKYPFLFAKWVLRAEEDEDVDPKAIEHFRTLLLGFKDEVEKTNVPYELREFFLRQITVLEKAVTEYKILGSRAFADAYGTVCFAVGTVDEKTKQAAGKAEHSAPGLVTMFIEAVTAVGNVSEATKKIHDAMPTLREWGQALLTT